MAIPVSRLDLNLFRVMDAVYEHGGISAAARQLHLSQPAVSHALARLRRVWGDPLFVRQGNRMVPTELTRRVMGEVQAHLRGLQSLLTQADSFDPHTLQMTLKVGMRDVLEAISLPLLVSHLSQVAPSLRVASVRVPRDELTRSLTVGDVDVVIDRQRRMDGGIRGLHLADEGLAVILREGHPVLETGLDESAYFDSRHVMVALRPEQPDPLQAVWATAGRDGRDIAMRCQHYFAAARVTAQSDLLLTLPRTYARELAQALPLVVHELPLPAPAMGIWMYWHAERERDPAHQWLRGEVLSAVRQALGSAHPQAAL